MQKYSLGQEVFIFRTNKGELHAGKGIIHVAECDKSGYILYTVKVQTAPDQFDLWRANNASLATTEEELKQKMDAYQQFNEEQKAKYIEIFGQPDFDPEALGVK